jgi:hypothetical protein avisC_02035
MVTKQALAEEALATFLHGTILILRLRGRETQADLFESLLSATEFGRNVYASHKLDKQLEKKLTKALKSTKKSFIKNYKRQTQQTGLPEEITNTVSEKLANDLERLELNRADLRRATIHPESFRTWLIENTIDKQTTLTELEKEYYSQLVDTVATVYSTHIKRTPNYTNEALDDIIETLDRISSHENVNITSGTPSTIPTSKDRAQGVLFGHFPQIAKYYTQRHLSDETESIEAKISKDINAQTGAHIVIIGPPGSGKTQMACNVANTFRHHFADKWALVAWLDASSPAQLRKSLISLGRQLGLLEEPEADTEYSISQLFSNIPNYYDGHSLLIYDNVNHIENMVNYIPNSDLISLLITTRSDKGWDDYAGWTTYKLTEFDKDTAVKLLTDITAEHDTVYATKIIEYTGGLPLTIGQIGATIRDDPTLSLSRYFTKLTTMQGDELFKPIAGASHDKPADKIFLNSISDLLYKMNTEERAEAVRQLSSLCYLSASGIPSRWITQEMNTIATRTYKRLVDSTIINESDDGNISSIHRLHAHILRNNWNSLGIDIFHACDLAAKTLIDIDVTISGVERYSEVRTLTQQCIEQYIALSNQDYSINYFSRAGLQSHLASVLQAADITCQQPEALHLDEAALLAIKRCGDKSTRSRLHAYYANILRFAGHHELALSHYSQAIGRISRISREQLVSEVSFRREQAHCLLMDHQPNKAITILERCRKKIEHQFGKIHIHTISILAELGFAYCNINSFQKAISMLEHISNIEIDNHDYFQITTISYARNVLGLAYISSGTHQRSKALQNFGLELLYRNVCIFQEYLPPEHTDSLSYRENLAWAFSQLGQRERALKQYEILLEEINVFYGEHHSHAFNVRLNIGITLMNLHRFKRAKVVLESLENELSSRLKSDSTVLANCRTSLGNTHFLLEEFSQALQVYEKVCYVGQSLPLPFKQSTAHDWFVLCEHLSASGHSREALRLGELARSLCES